MSFSIGLVTLTKLISVFIESIDFLFLVGDMLLQIRLEVINTGYLLNRVEHWAHFIAEFCWLNINFIKIFQSFVIEFNSIV